MDPAPAFSARGHRGGWVYRRKLYYEAFDELTRWARREFQVGVARVPWEEALDLHRSSLLAWQADFTDQSYRHLRDITPTSTTPSLPEADTNQSQFTNGHRPQLNARQRRLQHQLSHNNNQAPQQVHPPPQLCPPSRLQLQAQRRHRQQQGRESRLQLQAQRLHPKLQLRARPDLPPIRLQQQVGEGTLLQGGPHRGAKGHRWQGNSLPLHRHGRRQPDARDPEPLRAAAQSASGSRTRSSSPPARASLSGRPLILAPANYAYPTTRVDSAGIWILQHRYEGAPRPTRRAPRQPARLLLARVQGC